MGGLINFPMILIYIANVIILFLLLKKILHKPITNYLKKREDKIADQLDHAAQAEKDADDLKLKYQQLIEQAQTEAAKIIEESRGLANEQFEETVSSAKLQAKDIIERALREIDNEKRAAQNEMRTQITDMAMKIASKVLEREISLEDNRNIIDDFFEKVG